MFKKIKGFYLSRTIDKAWNKFLREYKAEPDLVEQLGLMYKYTDDAFDVNKSVGFIRVNQLLVHFGHIDSDQNELKTLMLISRRFKNREDTKKNRKKLMAAYIFVAKKNQAIRLTQEMEEANAIELASKCYLVENRGKTYYNIIKRNGSCECFVIEVNNGGYDIRTNYPMSPDYFRDYGEPISDIEFYKIRNQAIDYINKEL